jgi:hypothetical protein
MANSNPIKITDSGLYPDFIIPKSVADKTLFLTTKTELKGTGWELSVNYSLSLAGIPLDFDADPDINKQKIGKCSELNNQKFSLVAIVSLIRNGGPANPPHAKYTITFTDEDDNLIESFSDESDGTNPVTYYVKITLKMES